MANSWMRASLSESPRALSAQPWHRPIDQHGNTNCLWHQRVKELQALGRNFSVEKIIAGRIAARPSEAGDKAQPNWVFADAEHNGDRCCCRFGHLGSVVASGRGYHSHPTANEVRHERRQVVKFTLQPVVLHRHVLALDPAGSFKPFTKRINKSSIGLGRPEVN